MTTLPTSSAVPFDEWREDMIDADMSIAIIGMAGRFPGAPDVTTFWQNLVQGVEARTVLTDADLRRLVESQDELKAPLVAKEVQDPNYVRALPLLDNSELFDAAFFGYNPREAELIDPQQRLFLECAWHALEDAGYDPHAYGGLIGVYAGAHESSYATVLDTYREMMHSERGFVAGLGNQNDYLPTRTSYKLNLRGPSVEVQTACSTSLVAIHLARQSLLNGECDLALAGGVMVTVPMGEGYVYDGGGMVSPEGRCRTFDARAAGTVFSGGGIGIVVLKQLAAAVADGDHIYAVIKGSAIGNDGAVKAGFTAPSVSGQERTIAEALAVANMNPDTISYIEAHGTGTPLGDPIEIAALTQVYRRYTQRKGYCAIGTAKTNVGHLGTVAGVTGVIKTALSFKHRLLPGILHFETPNPKIDFANSPFFVNTQLQVWEPTDNQPRRAGVSAFGVGGTNAHVVMEEAPDVDSTASSRPYQLLLLSARTPTALTATATSLATHLRTYPRLNLADVAYTLQVGRHRFQQCQVVVCQDAAEAVATLTSDDTQASMLLGADDRTRDVVFMFSGQGAQYIDMGRELYTHEPVFRATVDRCAALLQPQLGLDLRALLYPSADAREEARQQLNRTAITQPALFVVEYAMAQLLIAWGIEPRAMIGHSVGEYVAACLAGVFTLEDGLTLIAARGHLMQHMPSGSMLSVALPDAELPPYLNGELSLAASNGPVATVVAGPTAAIERLEGQLTEQGITCRHLHTSHAFHSAMMDPILDLFMQRVNQVTLNPPTRPYISNVSGTWITDAEATSPGYWVRHLRQAVRFYEGLRTLAVDADTILLEVGPGRTLSTLARQAKLSINHTLSTLRHPQDHHNDYVFLLQTVGRLWAAGALIDWHRVASTRGERRQRVPLPGYPFERQRHWLEPKKIGSLIKQPQLETAVDMRDWFYVPSWRRTVPASAPVAVDGKHCLVFTDTSGLGAQLVAALRSCGYIVTTVQCGASFMCNDERSYTLDPHEASDYQRLLRALADAESLPSTIFHLWSVFDAAMAAEYRDFTALDEVQARGFYSLLWLAQALGYHGDDQPVRMLVVTNNLQDVAGEPVLLPQRATILGPAKVMPLEYPSVHCTSVDVALPATSDYMQIAHQLIAESASVDRAIAIAYRQRHRWVQGFEHAPLDSPLPADLPFRAGGVYLITGGLGGVGLTLAEQIANTVPATLVLVGRTALPARDTWFSYLANHRSGDPVAQRITAVQNIEALGSRVVIMAADVSNPAQVDALIAEVEACCNPIAGVIHAAGIAGGGMIQLKTAEAAAAVLDPKVRGVLALEAAMAGRNLDFFVLCSSIYAIMPALGQVDYCGANNFLDVFAAAHTDSTGTRTLAINWGGWDEVGMAVQAEQRTFNHPLVQHLHADQGQRQAYLTMLETAHNWVLNEHILMGNGAVPGTGYLELMRFLSPKPTSQQLLQLQDVFFVTPLVVEDDLPRPMLTIVRQEGERRAYTVAARSQLPDEQPFWEPHMIGYVASVPARPAPCFAIAELIARCDRARVDVADLPHDDDDEHLLIFGPRWQSVQTIYYGECEALAVLEFPAAYADELRELTLHPALLDAATKFGVGYFGQHAYLPLSYRSLLLYAPLPQRLFSYLRCRADTEPGAEVISFDLFLLDADGACVVEIEAFTLKLVADDQALTQSRDAADSGAAMPQRATPLTVEAEELFTRPRADQQRETGRISPREGAETFVRALSQPQLSQAVVILTDLEQTLADALATNTKPNDEATNESAPLMLNPRPALPTPYVAPRTVTEQQLVDIWQRVLGIEQVSIHDNFMELGGDSVMAIQVLAQAKAVQMTLTPDLIFQHQTIAALAEVLAPPTIVATAASSSASVGLPLTPGQARVLADGADHPGGINHSLVLELTQVWEPALLEDSVRHVLERHDIFQHHFALGTNGWEQRTGANADQFAFSYVELFYAAESNHAAIIEAQTAEVQAALNVTKGPLVSVVLFNRGRANDVVLVVVHQLVADQVSLAVLLAEIHTTYNALAQGQPVVLPPVTASLQEVVHRLHAVAQNEIMRHHATYWQNLAIEQIVAVPRDHSVEMHFNTEASARSLETALSFSDTQLLIEYTGGDETKILELVLAAMTCSLSAWTGSSTHWIEVARQGRSALQGYLADIDAQDTVGWLSPSFPLLIGTDGNPTAVAAFAAVRQAMDATDGTSYEILRYLHTPAPLSERFAAYPLAEIGLSLAPDWGELLSPGYTVLSDNFGSSRNPASQRDRLLDVRAALGKDRFQLRWIYSEQIHKQTTIRRLAQHCQDSLQQLLAAYHDL